MTNYLYGENKGAVSLTFGEDIKPGMTDEELTWISNTYKLNLDSRNKQVTKDMGVYKECLDLITRSKNRNDVLTKYKLESLSKGMALKLHDRVMEFKVCEQKKFEDLD